VRLSLSASGEHLSCACLSTMLPAIATLAVAVVGLPADRLQPLHNVLAANSNRTISPLVAAAPAEQCTSEGANASIYDYFRPFFFDTNETAGLPRGCACTVCSNFEFDENYHSKRATTEPGHPLCIYEEKYGDVLESWHESMRNGWSKSPGKELCTSGANGHDLEKDKRQAEQCLTPDYSVGMPQKTVWILGDSHAEELRLPLALATRGHFQVRGYLATGIGWVPGWDASPARLQTSSEVHEWLDIFHFVFDTIASHIRPGDVIVLMEGNRGIHVEETPHDILSFVETSVKETLENIILATAESVNAKLFVMGDWDAHLGESQKHPTETLANLVGRRDMVADIKTRHPDSIYFFDLYNLFCDSELPVGDAPPPTCQRYIPGSNLVAFPTESEHMNTAGALYIWPRICDIFEGLGTLSAGSGIDKPSDEGADDAR